VGSDLELPHCERTCVKQNHRTEPYQVLLARRLSQNIQNKACTAEAIKKDSPLEDSGLYELVAQDKRIYGFSTLTS
jgi:hypothetical protein